MEKTSGVTLFRKACNEMAFLKMGILGFPGTGKTFTAANIARGLHKYINAKKPVAFLDTETGSDFLIPAFQDEKIELLVFKSRAFVDLLAAVKEAEKNCSILIIDSISHFWLELMSSFKSKKDIERLQFNHWGPLKEEWRQFTDIFISSNLHIIMCGRAGWEYEFEENEDGKKDLIKTGTKMKGESEMGHEPSISLEMESYRTGKKNKIGSSLIHRCWVLKDRSNLLNGQCFDNPTFENFLPHINFLALGKKHITTDLTRNSEGLFSKNVSGMEWRKQMDIVLEEIKDEALMLYPSKSAEDNQAKIKLFMDIFGTSSWTKVSDMKLEDLQAGLAVIRKMRTNPAAMPKPSEHKQAQSAPALVSPVVDTPAIIKARKDKIDIIISLLSQKFGKGKDKNDAKMQWCKTTLGIKTWKELETWRVEDLTAAIQQLLLLKDFKEAK